MDRIDDVAGSGAFVVRLDGVQTGEYSTYEEAVGAGRNLKAYLPDHLISVWDLKAGRGAIIESVTNEKPRPA